MSRRGSAKSKFTVGSLFSGCGGFDLGFKQAGLDISWALDIDKDACETYERNIGPILNEDINAIHPSHFPKVDILVGGFPCQPFSSAGSRKGVDDDRGNLYSSTFAFVKELQPKMVVYENVRGFLSTRNKRGQLLVEEIKNELAKLGYSSTYRLLNFSHFGVPQNRIRVVFVAMKDPQMLEFVFPEVTVGKDLSIQRTLKGLDESVVNQLELLPLNPQAIRLGKLIPEGGSWKSLPDEVIPERWMKIRRNMRKYHFPNFFKRYARADVMGTITAAFKPENAAVWHPTESRVYSVREIARFQTFPDNFVFHGRNIKSKYQQIGNAVPPLFAKQLGERLALILSEAEESKLRYQGVTSDSFNVNRPISREV